MDGAQNPPLPPPPAAPAPAAVPPQSPSGALPTLDPHPATPHYPRYDDTGLAVGSYSPYRGAVVPFSSPASASGTAWHAVPSHGGVDGSAYTGGPSLSPLIQQRFDNPSVTQALPPQSVRDLNRIGANDYMSHNIIWNEAKQQALNDPNLHVVGPTQRTLRSSQAKFTSVDKSFFAHFTTMRDAGYDLYTAAHFANTASNHAQAAFYSMPDINQATTGATVHFESSVGVDYTSLLDQHEDKQVDFPIYAFAAINDLSVTSTSDLGDIVIPKSASTALASAHAVYWYEAIMKELAGLIKLSTWTLTKLKLMPTGANVMRCHYIFSVKRQRDGSLEKFKCRLVADGNTQKHGVDFDRIFSTVVKSTTIRMVLIVATHRRWHLSAIDIAQAYLQAELTEDLYMMVPPLIPAFDADGDRLVCKLNRSLYGLRQAGREWNTLLVKFIIGWGFKQSSVDVCLFTRDEDDGSIWLLIYVDDVVIACSTTTLREKFVTDLSKRFPTEDRGPLKWILGLSVEYSDGRISLGQSLFVSDLLERFAPHVTAGLSRKFDTPADDSLIFDANQCPAPGSPDHMFMEPRRADYYSIVGSLLWLANMTCFEISFIVSQLSRFVSNPGKVHWLAALRVLIYLKSRLTTELTFVPNSKIPFDIYVDSNWSSNKSVSGALFFVYGCLFAWFSKTQRSVSLSSAESEMFGLCLALKEGLFYRDLLFDLGILVFGHGPTNVYLDSKSAIDLSLDPVAFKKTKHIMRACFFARDHVAMKRFWCVHIAGSEMLADMLTKALPRPIFLKLIRSIHARMGASLFPVAEEGTPSTSP